MDDLISRQNAIKDAESWVAVDDYEKHLQKNVVEWLKEFPSAEHGTNLAEVGTDCISRQSAIDALRKLREEDIEDYGCEIPEGFNQDHLDRATFAIKQLPPIQPKLLQPWEVLVAQAVLPQPKRGKWICTGEPDESWGMMYECSICGNHDYGGNYCSYCGADMRTKETDCDYERAVEQLEHDMLYEPTFNQDDGSM